MCERWEEKSDMGTNWMEVAIGARKVLLAAKVLGSSLTGHIRTMAETLRKES
jgi:hypothetical protein